MRIFMWLADGGGCGYYRCLLPGDALARRGHDVLCSWNLPDQYRGGDLDVLVGQRTCNLGATLVWQKMAREGRTRLVYEVDDDLWDIAEHNRGAAEYFTPEVLARATENVRVADLVTVTTDQLAERVSQWNRNVLVLPNQVPSWLLDHNRPDTGRVTIGYAGGESHAVDFGQAAKPLKRVLQRNTHAEFHCLGPDHTARVWTPRTSVRCTPWVDGVENYLRSIDFTIGMAPLEDTEFNAAKSEIKLLEYSALGIPAVVSDVGPYARAIAEGAPAVAVNDHKEWESALERLVRDPSERAERAVAGREWASTRVIDKHIHEWEAAYQAL